METYYYTIEGHDQTGAIGAPSGLSDEELGELAHKCAVNYWFDFYGFGVGAPISLALFRDGEMTDCVGRFRVSAGDVKAEIVKTYETLT